MISLWVLCYPVKHSIAWGLQLTCKIALLEGQCLQLFTAPCRTLYSASLSLLFLSAFDKVWPYKFK